MKHIRLLIALITMAGILLAQVPQLINYQGHLTDTEGDPITGTQSIEFLIYHQAGGGDPVWSEIQAINVNDGNFSTTLGSVTPINGGLFNNENTYLAIKVGSDPEMVPRQRLTSVAYAFKAGNADSLGGITAYGFIQKGAGKAEPLP